MTWLWLALAACDAPYDGPAPRGDGAAVYGRVVGLLGAGLADVRVCVRGVDVPCVSSEPDGDFLVEGLPEDADVIVPMTRDGHLVTAYHHHTAVAQEWRKTLMPQGIVDSMTARVDVTSVPGRGHALFILWSGPSYDFARVEGVAFSIDGEATSFYQAGGGMPDPALTATSSSGSGGAFNLVPGDYHLTFTGAVCEPWFSFAFDAGAPVPITVLPDMASYVDLVCR